MVTVTKDALMRAVAEKTGLAQTDARQVIDAVLGTIRERSEAGDTVSVAGFGRFQVKARAARAGRNPATGEPMEIPETRRLTFKAFKG